MVRLFASTLALATLLGAAVTAQAARYEIDPSHTYPSFEADHMGGLSIWRGKFTRSSGTIEYDPVARTGSIDITVDAASADFGHAKLNEVIRQPSYLDVAQFPTATYKGKLTRFNGAVPGAVEGELTLHGVTRPVTLTINQFLCKKTPPSGREKCGADASATINRKEFGISRGEEMGLGMEVKLQIQVEGTKVEAPGAQ